MPLAHQSLKPVLMNVIPFSTRSPETTAENTFRLSAAGCGGRKKWRRRGQALRRNSGDEAVTENVILRLSAIYSKHQYAFNGANLINTQTNSSCRIFTRFSRMSSVEHTVHSVPPRSRTSDLISVGSGRLKFMNACGSGAFPLKQRRRLLQLIARDCWPEKKKNDIYLLFTVIIPLQICQNRTAVKDVAGADHAINFLLRC
ncbi:hypothetical protein F2P81_013396 [Scophthalmus maximus]|uniref:Uncharacterized protein n=1 Tax=Scophthalmus maximus TaxID=52904 RepID=A0A6A4SN07_SCOMX|nr:hypothetical protein F2P81_013396 [Scophthalmus maximus]